MKEILKIIDGNKKTIAYLNNLENGIVRQVVNGEYVISFTALIEELKTEYLHDENNLIEYDNDYFKVISIEEEHNSDNMLKVYVNCEHISYDLIKQTKLTYTEIDRSAIYVMNDLLLNSGFNFLGTDVITTASIDVQEEIDIKSLLYMVATIWGGELYYFQNDIELKQQLGQNRGADFRFGKNIQNIKRLIDKVEDTVSYEVEIVQGTELQELGYFQLGDTIKVVDDLLGIEIDIRIIEVEKDIVTGLNSSVILGQPINDLSTGFSKLFQNFKAINNKIDSKTIELNNAIESIVEDINAVADGQVITYYQDTEPVGKVGDLWFHTVNKKLYRYNTTWELIEDKDITTAIDKAQNAQDTADGKIVSYYQDTEPINAHSGDLWYDTTNGKMYRYNGTIFNLIEDIAISEIYTNIETIQTSIDDGMIITYYQATEPTGKHGDLWFNTTTKKLYTFTTTWQLIEDKDITTAIESAQNAQSTADGKIVSFYQDSMPTNEVSSNGDLWIDTNDSNKLYRYNGTNWISARDGSLALIDNVIDEHGNLIASKLSGALNTAITKVENSTSTVSFDNRGLITHNQPLESTSTKAILITSDGILIANAKNTDGTWRWRTAITADGISADEINTGTLTAININGVAITGSSVTSASAETNIVLNNGTLAFNRNNDTGQIKFAYRQGLPLGVDNWDIRGYERYKNGIPTDEKTLGLQCNGANFGIELGENQFSINSDYGSFNITGGMEWWNEAGTPGSPYYIAPGWYKTVRTNIYNDGFTIETQYGTISNSGFNVYGGVKNAIINTNSYGDIAYSAYEMSEVLLGDIGQSKVENGKVLIPIHQAFIESVDISEYHVFLTKYGKGDIWVSERTPTHFIVEGDDIPFSWEIKANRKDASINKFMPTDINQMKLALKELIEEKENIETYTIPSIENSMKIKQKELYKEMLLNAKNKKEHHLMKGL